MRPQTSVECRRRRAFVARLAASLLLAHPIVATHAAPCEPLPGDVSPLPTTQATNAFAAAWAEARARELTAAAVQIARSDPALSRRLLLHARCIDPEQDAARELLEELRPEIRSVPRVSLTVVADTDLDQLDRELEEIRSAAAEARFRVALEQSDAFLAQVEDDLDIPVVRERAASAAVVAAIGHTALGDTEAAEIALRKARDWRPELELGDDVSPKIRRLWDRIRKEAQ